MTNVKRFKKIVTENIERDGIENLMEWLEHETDFFTAPASTRYHGSYEGGLVEHSLNVYDRLVWEMENTVGAGWQEIYSPESIAIIALFHDLCKIDRYVITEKWRKDENGDWEAYEAYEYNKEKAEMGHGAQSVFYLQKFIQLTEFEAQAIFWHMGAYDLSPYASLAACSETFKWNPLAFLTHRADMAATYVTENEAFVYGEGTDEEEAKVEEEKSAKKPARRGRKTVEKDPEPVDEDEEQEEEKPKPTRRRRKKEEPKEEPEVDEDDAEDEDPKPTRITRRKKTAPKDERQMCIRDRLLRMNLKKTLTRKMMTWKKNLSQVLECHAKEHAQRQNLSNQKPTTSTIRKMITTTRRTKMSLTIQVTSLLMKKSTSMLCVQY